MDKFFYGFLKDIYLNEPCYNCKFKGTKDGEKREADITLADFWGVPKELYNKDGVSLVVINNKKGEKVFEKIKERIFFQDVSLEIGIKGNSSFYKSCTRPKERDLFYKEIDNLSFEELSNKYFKVESIFKRRIKRTLRILVKVLKIIKAKLLKEV